jgi:hypothetical protein
MNKDHAYEHCLMLLETSIGIWENRIQSRFALAEKNYQEARKIYEKNFSESTSGSADTEDRKPSIDAVAEWDAFFENNVDPF